MGGLLVGAGFLILALVLGSGATPAVTPPRGGRDPDVDPSLPGSGPIRPGPNNEGPPPATGGWGGGQYGPGPVPDDFEWNGSIPWVSADCQTVAEPLLFLPHPATFQATFWWMPIFHDSSDVQSQTQDSLANALLFRGPPRDWATQQPAHGTAWGYIARRVAEMQRRGETPDPVVIATHVLASVIDMQGEIHESCLEPVDALDPTRWTPALTQWWETLVERITEGVRFFVYRGDWNCCDDDPGIPFDVS